MTEKVLQKYVKDLEKCRDEYERLLFHYERETKRISKLLEHTNKALKSIKDAKQTKKHKCPYCGKQTNGHSSHNGCNMVIDKRGGWRQLGVYDG
jgi:DNA repair exonuclease SbcCD ATPase subunit